MPYEEDEVLHEHAAGAGGLVPAAGERVADLQRPRHVVGRVDHQPVAQPVHALVERERRAASQVGVVAHRPRGRGHRLVLDAHERPLDDPVVVARPAGSRTGRERLPDLALRALQRCGADRVRDPVAVALDRPRLRDRLLEALQRHRRALVVGEVAVGLLETREVALAVLELRVVRLELRGQRRSLEPAAGRLRDEGRDIADLVLAQLELEGRHRGAALLDLADDALVAGADRVQVRAGRAARAGRAHACGSRRNPRRRRPAFPPPRHRAGSCPRPSRRRRSPRPRRRARRAQRAGTASSSRLE